MSVVVTTLPDLADPQLVLQPRGTAAYNGPANFVLSVEQGIRLDEYANALGSDLADPRRVFPEGVARLWGSTPPAFPNNTKAIALRDRSSLGHLFLDKLFQLNIPVPVLGEEPRQNFLAGLLGVSPGEDDEKEPEEEATPEAESAADDLGGIAPEAVRLAAVEAEKYSQHMLSKFSHLLHGNPRGIKLFTNTYSVLRMLRRLEGSPVPQRRWRCGRCSRPAGPRSRTCCRTSLRRLRGSSSRCGVPTTSRTTCTRR
ncbi:hypothetical protein [Kutzneria albida]|uniref:Uncharacterized protein n=1 Tax=Kutzneria albida DSM 43870 TaxID=1449976 RepID=W5W8W3_9PSEU|nr:hypothetical protein [Kutzneria albida]AHH97588.1 hypothetical protein KALB_4225 [Kutzneria albida DSM 43870]